MNFAFNTVYDMDALTAARPHIKNVQNAVIFWV